MSESLAREQVIEQFCEILEAYGFMFADPAEPAEVEAPEAELLCVFMAFHGDGDGTLEVLTTRLLCEELVANALGEDVEDHHLEELDSVKELANMLCGHLLTEHFGETPVFNLTIPEVRPATTEDWAAALSAPECAAALVDSEYPVLIRFRAGAGAAEPVQD